MKPINSKRAAMEMSVGTIVTIVLLMTVLILGLILVRTIFRGAVENINGIDQAVKGEINKLFAEDNSRKIVVYPPTRLIKIQKGEQDLGFGFSIRNIENAAGVFSYSISAEETSCGMRLSEAEDLITLGKDRNNIVIPAGNIMDDPVFIRFGIPESTSPCQIRYSILIEKGNSPYGASIDVDLIVTGK